MQEFIAAESKRRKVTAILMLLACAATVHGHGLDASRNGDVFASAAFTSKFFKEFSEYDSVPVLDDQIKTYEGKERILQGHYPPFEVLDKILL
jgi:hypothetical protein